MVEEDPDLRWLYVSVSFALLADMLHIYDSAVESVNTRLRNDDDHDGRPVDPV